MLIRDHSQWILGADPEAGLQVREGGGGCPYPRPLSVDPGGRSRGGAAGTGLVIEGEGLLSEQADGGRQEQRKERAVAGKDWLQVWEGRHGEGGQQEDWWTGEDWPTL